jgi:hypothetical protein
MSAHSPHGRSVEQQVKGVGCIGVAHRSVTNEASDGGQQPCCTPPLWRGWYRRTKAAKQCHGAAVSFGRFFAAPAGRGGGGGGGGGDSGVGGRSDPGVDSPQVAGRDSAEGDGALLPCGLDRVVVVDGAATCCGSWSSKLVEGGDAVGAVVVVFGRTRLSRCSGDGKVKEAGSGKMRRRVSSSAEAGRGGSGGLCATGVVVGKIDWIVGSGVVGIWRGGSMDGGMVG